LRDFFSLPKPLPRHRKFAETVTVSDETACFEIGYGKSRDKSPLGKNGKNSRKIRLLVKRRSHQTTE
jgi:hypothetical protein